MHAMDVTQVIGELNSVVRILLPDQQSARRGSPLPLLPSG